MRQIRVRAERGAKFASALRILGYQAEWLGAGSAPTTLHGGCADPGHCPQHEAAENPQAWGSVRTSASGERAHYILSELTKDGFFDA